MALRGALSNILTETNSLNYVDDSVGVRKCLCQCLCVRICMEDACENIHTVCSVVRAPTLSLLTHCTPFFVATSSSIAAVKVGRSKTFSRCSGVAMRGRLGNNSDGPYTNTYETHAHSHMKHSHIHTTENSHPHMWNVRKSVLYIQKAFQRIRSVQ